MPSELVDAIIRCDLKVWYYVNTQWHTPFLDTVVPFLRNQWFWSPLYLFLVIFMPYRFRRNGIIWCIAFLLTFLIADQASTTLIKPFFHRLRPCHTPELAGMIRLLVSCGGQYSFPSTHASNHFALSVFSAVTLGRFAKWIWPVALVWAFIVCYSQVYVGVHFPLDITCGGILGSAIGMCTGKLFNRFFPLNMPVKEQPRKAGLFN